MVEIEVFSFCNRRCWFCPNSTIDRHSSNIFMDENLYHSILSDLNKIKYKGIISYSRYNEPLADRIIIEEIYIDGAEVTYEAGLTGSNIGKIKKNIEEFAGPPKEGEEPKEKEGEGKKIQINRFVFSHQIEYSSL